MSAFYRSVKAGDILVKKSKVRKNPENQSRKVILWGMGLLLVVLFIFVIKGLSSAITPSSSTSGSSTASTGISPTGSATAEIKGGVQEVSLNVSATGYNPNKLIVKKGIPVRIQTNSTQDAGCVRGLMIPDFNINEPLDIGSDVLEFTPDKTGTFEFMCQMRMSKGTLEVIS